MLLTNNSPKFITDKNQLTDIFFSGCKTEERIGVESEKILVYKDDYKAAKYNDVVKILRNFDKTLWQKIFEGNNLIGLKSDFGAITLEPGSQIEISLKPLDNLDDVKIKLNDFYTNLEKNASEFGIIVYNRGIQPVSTYENIDIIPKKRYEYMTKYLPKKGLTPFIMMRETAGIQVNFDYKSQEDAIKKLSLALKMSPFISAIYSNSSVRQGKQTGYKSFRANSWLNVDEDRCGYISKKLFDKNLNFSFMDYVQTLLDVPMIFIQRGTEYYETNQTFGQFLKDGYMGIKAEISDWENQMSLYFPDVRLKSYIEIRNHDAQNDVMTYSVPAFWKGIIYNNDAMNEVSEILKKYSYEDFMQLRKDAPLLGINAKFGKFKIIDLIKEFFNISYKSLKCSKNGEEKYLDAVFYYIQNERMPIDDLN